MAAPTRKAAERTERATAFQVVGNALSANDRHAGFLVAGGLAFFTALSLAPLFVVALNMLERLLGRAVAAGQFAERLTPIVGSQAAAAVQGAVAAGLRPGQGELASVIAIAVSVVGAAGLFLQVRAALDVIFEQPRPTGAGGFIREALRAALALFWAALGLVAIAAAGSIISALAPGGRELGIGLAEGLVTAVVYWFLLALAFRYLALVRTPWPAVLIGAGAGAIIAVVTTAAMAAYLGLGFATNAYGAAAGFWVLLLWLWTLGLSFVYGAEISHAWSRDVLGREPEAAPKRGGRG